MPPVDLNFDDSTDDDDDHGTFHPPAAAEQLPAAVQANGADGGAAIAEDIAPAAEEDGGATMSERDASAADGGVMATEWGAVTEDAAVAEDAATADADDGAEMAEDEVAAGVEVDGSAAAVEEEPDAASAMAAAAEAAVEADGGAVAAETHAAPSDASGSGAMARKRTSAQARYASSAKKAAVESNSEGGAEVIVLISSSSDEEDAPPPPPPPAGYVSKDDGVAHSGSGPSGSGPSGAGPNVPPLQRGSATTRRAGSSTRKAPARAHGGVGASACARPLPHIERKARWETAKVDAADAWRRSGQTRPGASVIHLCESEEDVDPLAQLLYELRDPECGVDGREALIRLLLDTSGAGTGAGAGEGSAESGCVWHERASRKSVRKDLTEGSGVLDAACFESLLELGCAFAIPERTASKHWRLGDLEAMLMAAAKVRPDEAFACLAELLKPAGRMAKQTTEAPCIPNQSGTRLTMAAWLDQVDRSKPRRR